MIQCCVVDLSAKSILLASLSVEFRFWMERFCLKPYVLGHPEHRKYSERAHKMICNVMVFQFERSFVVAPFQRISSHGLELRRGVHQLIPFQQTWRN